MVLCALAMTILGSSFPITRLLLGYPVLAGQALRYTLAALVLASLAGSRARPAGRDLLRLGALAATGLVGFNICVLNALRSADPALLGTVIGAVPLLLALLGPALAKRRPAVRVVAGAVVVVLGVALVEGSGRGDLTGFAWALGALAGEVAFSVLAAPMLPRLGVVPVSAWACILAVPMLLLASVLTGEQWRAPTLTESGALLYLALVLTVGAFLLWYSGLRRLGVERAGMFAGVLPVATLAVSAGLDGRNPGTIPLVGVALVAAALVGAGYPERSAARTASA